MNKLAQLADEGIAAYPVAEGQTRDVLHQIDTLLAEAGTNKAYLLQVHIFLADMADFPAMNRAWDAWLDRANPPARATVQAHLADPAWRVEMTATAALPAPPPRAGSNASESQLP